MSALARPFLLVAAWRLPLALVPRESASPLEVTRAYQSRLEACRQFPRQALVSPLRGPRGVAFWSRSP